MEHWRTRFFTIWAGQALSLIGSALVQFALVWWLTTETGSATVLALATLVAMLPGVLIGPFAGVVADRWNRRAILIFADGVVALAALGLLVSNLLGQMTVWQVYLMLAVRSIAGAFHWPTMAASTSLMAPKEELTRIGGLNQSLEGFSRIVAPPVAAMLLSIADVSAVLAIDIVTAVLAIGTVLIFPIPQPDLTPEQMARESGTWVLHDLRDGLGYVWARRPLVILVAFASILNLVLAPAFALLPLLVNQVFEQGAGALAVVETAGGLGVILGGATLAAWGGFKRRVHTALMGLAGLGVGGLMIGLAPVQAFWLVVAGMLVVGAMGAMVNGPIMALLQSAIENAMQARVFSLIGSLSNLVAPIGLLIAGPFADAFGIRTWYVLGSISCLLLALAGRFSRDLVDLERAPVEGDSIRSPNEPEALPPVALTEAGS